MGKRYLPDKTFDKVELPHRSNQQTGHNPLLHSRVSNDSLTFVLLYPADYCS